MSDILVEYRIGDDDANIHRIGEKIAKSQSLGNYRWGFGDKVDGDYEASVTRYGDRTVEVAFPVENITASTSQLLNYIGGDLFDAGYVSEIKITGIDFPPEFVKRFPGPQYGIETLRERAGVVDRPMLGLILKPAGLTPERMHDIAVKAGVNGVDVVKEDIKFVSPAYCPLEDRIRAIVSALREIESETGRRPLYVLNVTGETQRFKRLTTGPDPEIDLSDVKESIVLMQSPVSSGFDHMERIADDDEFQYPIHAHWAGHGVYTQTNHGIALDVLEKLFRLSGADSAHTGNVAGDHSRSRSHIYTCKSVLRGNRRRLGSEFKRTLPVVSHQVSPENIYRNMQIGTGSVDEPDYDTEQLFVVGSAIYSYPSDDLLSSVAGGVRACREAIDATLAGITDDDVHRVVSDQSGQYEAMQTWLDENA
jgi:ribulose 1,5-bisphosphate carboxylase large subunit-like protein